MSDAGADASRWDARYREQGAPAEPSPLLVALADRIPRSGRTLDVAGGGGRNAIWLAQRGLDVTLVDVSTVGLAIARERAATAGVALSTVAADLEREPLPAGPWDLIVSFHYLHRPLFPRYAAALAPGGLLIVAQATVRNLERHERPSRRFLLDEGELRTLVPDRLSIERCDEGWRPETDHHDAVLIARNQD